MATPRLYAFFTDGAFTDNRVMAIGLDGSVVTATQELDNLSSSGLLLTSAFNGAWIPNPAVFPGNSAGGFSLVDGTNGTVDSVITGFAGNWGHWDYGNTDDIIAYNNTGTEPVDDFTASRPGLSLLRYNIVDNTRDILGPAFTDEDEIDFYFIPVLARSPLTPEFVYAFCLTQVNAETDTRLAVAKWTSGGSFVEGAIVDEEQSNGGGFTLGIGDATRPFNAVLSPDGSKLFYYHFGDQPTLADFKNVHWMQQVDASTLVAGPRSETPFEAGVSGSYPWDEGIGMPCGPFRMASSETGLYVFSMFPQLGSGGEIPYILWKTDTNDINYGIMSDISGFDWTDYLNGLGNWSCSGICFDNNDDLWLLLRPTAGGNLHLIKFTISGTALTQDLIVDFDGIVAGFYTGSGLMFSPDEEVEVPEDADAIGGSGAQVEPVGIVFDLIRTALPAFAMDSCIELGPFRFAEQKQADETAMITSLILGISQEAIGVVVFEDYMEVDDDVDDEDWNTEVDQDGDDIFEDWGEGSGNSDDFELKLMSTDDGISPQFQGKETLDELPDLDYGSSKQFVPTGYSAIFHRLEICANEVDQYWAIKTIDIAGVLTGRHL